MDEERAGTGRLNPADSEVLAWISDGCVLLDPELLCKWINVEASSLLAVSNNSLIGKRLRDVDAAASSTAFTAFRAAAEQTLRLQIRQDVEVLDAGSGRWLAMRLYPSRSGIFALIADITRRKTLEIETALHLEELRGLVQQAPAFLWVVDRDMRVQRMYGADSLLRQIGADQIVGRTIDEGMALGNVPPDAQALWRTMHLRALGGGVGEYLAHYGGLAVEARVQPLRDGTGRIIGILGVGIDVTEQERSREKERNHLWFLQNLDRVYRAMQATSDLEEMMRSVLDVVVEAFGADRAGLIYPCDPHAPSWSVAMERAAADVTPSVPHDEPMAADFAHMLRIVLDSDGPAQFGPELEHQLPAAAKDYDARSALLMAIYPKVGAPYLFGLSQAVVRVWTPDEARLFREIGSHLADGLTSLKILHDLRASEQALRVSEARFRIFSDQASDLFFLHDEQGTIVDVNRQACVSLGYAREELIGLGPQQLEADVEPRRYAAISEPPATAEVIAFETRLRRKDGAEFPVDARGRWFTEGGRRFMLYLVRDITERKRLEAELLQAQKMEAIGQLAGGVAHDFNNLLTVIVGYSEVIHGATGSNDECRSAAEEIRYAADRAARLTQQLLAFSRKQTLSSEVVDVNAVVEETSRMLRRVIGEDVRLELKQAPNAASVLIDVGQLQQVLMNLAVNARDAMPLGGQLTIETARVTIDREIPAQPAPLAPGSYVRLAMTDTGEGMRPDVVARAFEPFFTTKGVGKGTGLGLSTVYGIVSQSRGRLRVDSAPGHGTMFEIFFPEATAEAAAATAAPTAARPVARGAETVLLVEDDPMVRRLGAQLLTRAGYRVLAADGAAEAMRIANTHEGPIDLLVTDVVMPGLPGPELVARLEAARPGVRVLYVSGYAGDAVTRYGVREERVSFLAKPFTPDALTRRVREVLDTEG